MNTPLVRCPQCEDFVRPVPHGVANEDGEWEYVQTECPTCDYVFKADEL